MLPSKVMVEAITTHVIKKNNKNRNRFDLFFCSTATKININNATEDANTTRIPSREMLSLTPSVFAKNVYPLIEFFSASVQMVLYHKHKRIIKRQKR